MFVRCFFLFLSRFPDVRTGHTFARLDVFLLMHFIASCYMLCLLCFMAYHLFLSGEIMMRLVFFNAVSLCLLISLLNYVSKLSVLCRLLCKMCMHNRL